MNVTVEQTDAGEIRVLPEGYIDLHTVRALRRSTEDLPLVAGTRVVLDLTGVGFMDSAGLTFLIGLRRRTDQGGVTLDVRGVRPEIAKVLRLTGLDTFLGVTGLNGAADVNGVSDGAAPPTPRSDRHGQPSSSGDVGASH